MKNKIKAISKSFMSMLLALLVAFSTLPLTVFAADDYITDMNSNAEFGVIEDSLSKTNHELHYSKYKGKTYIVFCCQYGVKSPDGSTYEYGKAFKKYLNRSGETYEDIADYISFGYTFVYGDGLPKTKDAWIAACCTQQYVWEKLGVNPSRSSWDSDYMDSDKYKAWLSDTKARIKEYYDTQPSFNNSKKTINLGDSLTLTDSNGVFKYYPSFEKTVNKVKFSHTNGKNTLIIEVADDCTTHSVKFNSATYDIHKNLPTGQKFDENKMNYCYFEFDDTDGVQDLMFSNNADPQTFLINIDVTFGNLKITKTSEDNIVSGIDFTVTGNGKTYTMTTDSKGTATLSNIPVGTYTITEKGITRYVAQATKTATVKDGETANVTFTNKLKKGDLKIQKDSDDKIVSDFTFSVKGSDGSSYSAITNSKGVATLTDLPVYDSNNKKITYTVKETSVPARYKTPDNETVTLEADKTSTVNIFNDRYKGNIEIQKDSDDKIITNFTFSITGSDGSSYSAITNSKGVATLTDLPVYDSNNNKITYTVKETNVPIRYVTPDKQTVILEPEKTSDITFNNILKKFRVKVTKEDIEKGKAQGDATLAGAVYGLYKGETLVAEYTTDSNASFTTDYFVCADDWTIKEITSSDGYLVNDKAYKVGAKPELYTVEFNTTTNKVQEQVIKGNISIIKHTDNVRP